MEPEMAPSVHRERKAAGMELMRQGQEERVAADPEALVAYHANVNAQLATERAKRLS